MFYTFTRVLQNVLKPYVNERASRFMFEYFYNRQSLAASMLYALIVHQ
jgi:hypothetical protein